MAEPPTMSTREGAPEQAVDLGVKAHPRVVVSGGGASSGQLGVDSTDFDEQSGVASTTDIRF
jgi:hypothetical protein